MLSLVLRERERIAYRVTSVLSDIRRVVRVKVQKRKRRLTREVALDTSQDVIKEKKRKKERRRKRGRRYSRARRDREGAGRSIIAETGNILTGGLCASAETK